MNSLLFYIVSFLIIIIIGMMFDNSYEKNKKTSKLLLIVIFILMTIISGYRYYVGSDYTAYVNMYYMHSYLDFGSKTLFDLANKISSNPQTIIVLFSALTNFFLLISLYKIRAKTRISLILATYLFIYFPFSFNIIRQSLSMLICLYSFILLYERKNFKSFLFLLLGIMFHNSAIICLPYSFLIIKNRDKENLNKKINKLTFFLLFSILFYSLVLNNIFNIKKYFGYMRYFSLLDIDIKFILSYLPFYFFIFIFNKSIKQSNILNVIKSIFISGTIIEIMFSSTQIYRLGMYFSLYSIILIPTLFKKSIMINTERFLNLIYLTFLIIYFIFNFYYIGRAQIFPYHNQLFNI